MDGIEWVVHTSVFQAVANADLDAWNLLSDILNHHVLAVDRGEEIVGRYREWLSNNRNEWVTQWYQRIEKSVNSYPVEPLPEEAKTALAGFGLAIPEHVFVATARQTVDRLLAGDEIHFDEDARDYLTTTLRVRAVTDWEEAVHVRQPLTGERVQKLIRRGESQQVEFKLSLALVEEAAETLAAFANSIGGGVLFGVRNDGKLAGVQIGQNTLENLAREIAAKVQPVPRLAFEQIELDGRTVIVVGTEPMPYGEECRVRGHIYRRIGRMNKRIEE